MKTEEAPVPPNEMERLVALTELDLDYSNLEETFKDLNKLAASVAGTPVSLVNFIDTFTQWTVSSYNIPVGSIAREESACQYTIMTDEGFEVKNFLEDDRFKEKSYVTGAPNFRYYFGIPLKTEGGLNVGALCVLDHKAREMSPEKVELLKIIANEIMVRLTTHKLIVSLQNSVSEANAAKLSVAHDIRGPLSGIMNLAQVVVQQGDKNKVEDILQFIKLIYKSSRSLLELADEILSDVKMEKTQLQSNELNLVAFKETLEKLYTPQALNKKITYTVSIANEAKNIPFSKNKLLQITGNLISNAIKFTPEEGSVKVELRLIIKNAQQNVLCIMVEDSGVGIDSTTIRKILEGDAKSTEGTTGEKGYGFGLSLVKHLVESLNGTIRIESAQSGTTFFIELPQAA